VTARREDAERNRERIVGAASRLLAQSPSASLAEIAAAARESRARRSIDTSRIGVSSGLPRGTRWKRARTSVAGAARSRRPVPLDPIHVLDVLVEFSNWLEHVGVVLLSLGVLLEDFAVVVVALVGGVAGVLLDISLGSAALKGLSRLS
jgi:hypothetical protein